MRSCRVLRALAVCLAAVSAASCGKTARIDGQVQDLQGGDVVVKLPDVNTYNVLDTVSVDASGKFSYRFRPEKGQPDFVYIFHNDTRIASLLLQQGDKVHINADTLGNYTVEGSPESIKLAGVEKAFADFTSGFTALAERLDGLDAASSEAASVRRAMGKAYTDYYRSRVKYIMENSRSLTVVPVLYQTVGALPVFGQETDAIHFRNICDSLKSVYPDSKYVAALETEAKRRTDLLALKARIESAPQMDYPDLELPDVHSEKVKLSEVDAKVIMVHFWTSSNAAQKMFNLDVLKPIYKEFHSRGLEIYQVALDVDKALWARTVRDQGLEWINVCDGLGGNSPAVLMYNIGALPATFIISDGELVDGKGVDLASLRKLLSGLLR